MRTRCSMMMMKQSLTIGVEIIDYANVDQQDQRNRRRVALDQFAHLDRNEERRFANRHPAGPAYTKHKSHPFHERKHAVEKRPGREQPDVRGIDRFEPGADLAEELALRIDIHELEQRPEIFLKISPRELINAERDQQKKKSFAQLDQNDQVKREAALLVFSRDIRRRSGGGLRGQTFFGLHGFNAL